jgi:hypothetical protein
MKYCDHAHHFIATSDEDGHGARVCAFLDHEHLVARGSERDFTNDTRLAQFLRCEVFEPRHDATLGGDGDELKKDSCGSAVILPQ